MRIGETRALEVRHRISLAPDDVVEDPEPHVLHDRAEAEDVVVRSDHPQRAVRFQHAARFGEPVAGKLVVDGKAGKLVPVVGHGIDVAAVRAREVAAELQVVRRIGEDHVHAGIGDGAHRFDAVAGNDLPQRQKLFRSRRRRPRANAFLDQYLTHICPAESPFKICGLTPW